MSNKPFKDDTKHYSNKTAAETPYQRAGQLWDQRLGSSYAQAKNWRLVAMILGVIAIILAILLIVAVMNMRPKLFVAEVDTGGKVVNVQPLKVAYSPTDTQKQYFLADFIRLIRGVPLDPVVAKKNWTHAYSFLSQRGVNLFNTYWQSNSPVKLLGKETVTVVIDSVNPISANTFNITWTETTIDMNGKQLSKKNYSGVFTIALLPPKTQAAILENPLGLYITDFNFSEKK